jgi:hypothetical protein
MAESTDVHPPATMLEYGHAERERSAPAVVRGAAVGALLGGPAVAVQTFTGWGFGLSGGSPVRFMSWQVLQVGQSLLGLLGGVLIGAVAGAVIACVAALIGRPREGVIGTGVVGGLLLGLALGYGVLVDRMITVSAGPPGTGVREDHAAYVNKEHPAVRSGGSATGSLAELHATVTYRRRPGVVLVAVVAGGALGGFAGAGVWGARRAGAF